MVRILGGCTTGLCAGSLISARIIVSSFHCTVNLKKDEMKSCDHSDRKRLAIIGAHNVDMTKVLVNKKYRNTLLAIPIIDVMSPSHSGFSHDDNKSHDFAIMILEKPVQWNKKASFK